MKKGERVLRYFNMEWDRLNFAVTLPEFIDGAGKISEEAAYYNDELFNKLYEEYCMKYNCFEDDLEKKREFIKNNYQQWLDTIKDSLPESIKVQIPDIRILALGTVTTETYNIICSYANEAKSRLDNLIKNYERDKEKAESHMSDRVYETMNQCYHDSYLMDVCYEDKNLYMKLCLDGNSDNLEVQYAKLIFKNAVLVKGNIQSKLYRWKYHEIYYENDQFEIHIRFSDEEIIIQASDIYRESYKTFFLCDKSIEEKFNNEVFRGTIKELIEAGHVTRENTLDHPLRKSLGDTEFENVRLIRTKDLNSFGKLEVVKTPYNEMLKKITNKSYVYQIKFLNHWGRNPDVWLRGPELLEYIKDNCNNELELWSVWSDSYEDIETRYIQLEKLCENDLESVYQENVDGIVRSRRLIIYK